MTVELNGLSGSTPIGFFAALGALAALDRQAPELEAKLGWTDTIVPRARIEGPSAIDQVIELVEADRIAWSDSKVLHSGPDGAPVADIKPTADGIRAWARLVRSGASPENRRDVDHFSALLAEDALAGKNDAKPTHFHFTAGQQRFVTMLRELQASTAHSAFEEAIAGPWMYEAKLPVMAWDVRGSRPYALRGTNPSKDVSTGVPGADWLAFVGLTFFPVARSGRPHGDPLKTTGCGGSWKSGFFRWPLWEPGLSAPVIRSLLAWQGIGGEDLPTRRLRGVFKLLEAPIRRSDQGGYGSFGPVTEVQ